MNNDWREYTGDIEYELYHHGILGQKWGVRRFEDASGHLTAAGKARYNTDSNGDYIKVKGSGKSTVSSAKSSSGEGKSSVDNAKLQYRKAKLDYKQAKSNYKESYKNAYKNAQDSDAKKNYDKSSDEFSKAKEELQAKREELKAEKEANKKHLTTKQKVAIGVAAVATVSIAALAISHRKQIKAGADKIDDILRTKKNDFITNRTAHKVESALKKETIAKEATAAKIAGLRKPFVEKRKSSESQAKDLINKYYSPEDVDKAYKEARMKLWNNMSSKEDLDKYSKLDKNSFINEAGPSEGVKHIVDQWLSGETFQNKTHADASDTNSIQYLEKILDLYGYRRKS